MIRKLVLLSVWFWVFLPQFMPVTAQESLSRRIILIGGSGEDILDAVHARVPLDSTTTIVFLGNDAVNEKTPTDSSARLSRLQNTEAKIIFIPGSNEWANGRKGGYKTVLSKQASVKAWKNEKIMFLPEDGCPGPEALNIGKDITLVLFDSQWWLHEHDKPGVESECANKTQMQVLDDLKDIVDDNRKKLVIFASHHPFRSTGTRSGYFGLKQHLFPLTDIRGLDKLYLPLPVVGSIYPITRGVFISRQDMTHVRYQQMISSFDAVLSEHPFLVRVAGHEHILELFKEKDHHYIVSGAGKKAGRAQSNPSTLYAAGSTGFTVLEITPSKDVKASFFVVKGDQSTLGHTTTLFNFSKLPPIAADTAHLPLITADSITAAVNSNYAEVSGLKRWLLGNNYRKEWATPVRLKVFRLNSEKGGFTIEGQGGGNQTMSVRLKDASGKSWSLRSINKDPEKVVPEKFRHTFARDVVQDMISASHPYASAPVTALSSVLNIPAPEVQFYFVPNDTAFGYYRPAYANTVVMLEERDPSLHGEKTHSTSSLFNARLDKEKVTVNQQSFLKARMFDILIADFDRHYEQYKWGVSDQNKRTYYAVPKDRDQAFFHSDGVVMKLFAYNRMPFLKGLRHDIPNVRWYGFVARDIDGLFLNQLNKHEWQAVLQDMNTSLSDSVITNSVKLLPSEIYEVDGREITDKLKNRSKLLSETGMEYYSFLATKVNVLGSNLDEEFIVSEATEGIKVEVLQKDSLAASPTLTYSRIFHPSETREIRLYGLNGNDNFRINEDAKGRIKIRMIGGKGNDSFDIHGKVRNIVYDASSEDNTIVSRSRTTNMISGRKDVNTYSFRENNYNSIKIPTINFGFNIEDQFLAGLGFSITKQGFRTDPFASEHRFTSLFSFINQAYQLRYSGEIIDFYRHYDLLINSSLINPHLNNFFGYGNESYRDTAKPLTFYRVRFSSISADLSVRKRFFYNKMGIWGGPVFYYYWNNLDRNSGRILSRPSDVGLDSADVYTKKMYGGGQLSMGFNSVDNDLLATKGIDWSTSITSLTALNEASLPLLKLQSVLSLYAPLSSNKRFVFVLNAGGGHILSDHFEYFQAFTLGANNYLRGYRKNRFTGSSMAYGSVELRARLIKLQARMLPGDIGIIGLNDIGRVWIKNESSTKWHHSYGGGLYFTPFNLVMLSAIVAKSEEETLFNISIGTKLNITF
jgi:hypothetical protein